MFYQISTWRKGCASGGTGYASEGTGYVTAQLASHLTRVPEFNEQPYLARRQNWSISSNGTR